MSKNSDDPREVDQFDNPYAPPAMPVEKKEVRSEPDEVKDYFMEIWLGGAVIAALILVLIYIALTPAL